MGRALLQPQPGPWKLRTPAALRCSGSWLPIAALNSLSSAGDRAGPRVPQPLGSKWLPPPCLRSLQEPRSCACGCGVCEEEEEEEVCG